MNFSRGNYANFHNGMPQYVSDVRKQAQDTSLQRRSRITCDTVQQCGLALPTVIQRRVGKLVQYVGKRRGQFAYAVCPGRREGP